MNGEVPLEKAKKGPTERSRVQDLFYFKPACGAPIFYSKTEARNQMMVRLHRKVCKKGCQDAPIEVTPDTWIPTDDKGRSLLQRRELLDK